MKNKLVKILCMIMVSALTLSSPLSALAAEEEIEQQSEFTDGEETPQEAEPAVTETPVATPEPVVTETPVTTPEPVVTEAPVTTPEPVVTETPSADPTATPSADPTATPSADPTATPSADPTATPSADPTATPVPTQTPAPTAKPTATPTATPSAVTEAVKKLISAISALESECGGTVTLAYESRVSSLRASYNNLGSAEKKQVTNYSVLQKFENQISELKKENSKTDITDDTGITGKSGTPVYYVGNLHAGKEFYLDSLKDTYHLTFSDDFSSVMDEIESEYKAANKLTDTSDTSDTGLTTSADSLLVRNWQDILAVYVYRQSEAGKTDFTLDSSSKEELAKIFAEMNPVVRDTEKTTHASYGNYHINDYIKKNNIDDQKDRSILKKYVETDCKLLCAIVTDAKGFVRQSVGDDVSEERVNVITAAYSLVGEVGYFWGGKSTAIGEDPGWGSAETVSAEGSASTGTVRAYGLDCSGFVTWSVINGYLSEDMQSSVGDGTSEQWENANVVSEQDAQPGDLVFQRGPEAGSDNHVGIICGQTDSGDWIAVHCSSSKNGVTVGEAYGASFRYIRQPSFYPTEEEQAEMITAGENADNAEPVEITDTTDTTAADITLTDTADTSSADISSDTSGSGAKAETTASLASGGTAADDNGAQADAEVEAEIIFEDGSSDGSAFSDTASGTVEAGTVSAGTAEVTDSLQSILDKSSALSDGSEVILPQPADSVEAEIAFE